MKNIALAILAVGYLHFALKTSVDSASLAFGFVSLFATIAVFIV